MTATQKPNDWEAIGWQWVCHLRDYSECEASGDGFVDDYRKTYGEAKAHADANPDGHFVHLEQMRRRLVIPAAPRKVQA